ncbi:hypothetical protein ScalyP_jg4205 [Parmales sp. scaly parma]|nr:hypothetical protein ScalyP_jg4205 [Parmales sp. scaly parma]
MVSLFQPEETIFDTYAACVAATEPLRNRRDTDVFSALKPVEKVLYKLSRNSVLCSGAYCDKNPRVNLLCTRHLNDCSRVIRSLGLTIPEYNAIGRKVSKSPNLEKRVREQAYLYRIASTMALDKLPVVEDPNSAKLVKARSRRREQRFARSLGSIEELRGEQREALRRALNIDALPTNFAICDPFLLPLLSPKIQSVCRSFPKQAEEVVRQFGLNSNEFNKMLAETRRNPLYRWRITRYMKRVGVKKSPASFSSGNENEFENE